MVNLKESLGGRMVGVLGDGHPDLSHASTKRVSGGDPQNYEMRGMGLW